MLNVRDNRDEEISYSGETERDCRRSLIDEDSVVVYGQRGRYRRVHCSRVHNMAARGKEEPTKQRYQANARERDRTHRLDTDRTTTGTQFEGTRSSLCSVNTAFSALRTLIPTEPADRKLSKIETLRLASSYISHLDAMLVAGAIDQPCSRLLESSGVYSTRPQVCTFCLAMHKRYNFDIPYGIPDYSNEETSSYIYRPTSATFKYE
ncbi:LOW QUALITY PROTEIN: basic helix-loop-helix transcription factor scleraxis [Pogonomyrmex barbatus]|uniref:LOW QUALITY PROTEIN: basic helix-loop-helix transcription factor scleraxis n=1 Tax=Pogonomyrmex barbatus TaxID=144034 RepID=A0A8N1S5A7_9HYME|nr:LOW QUALITY PROTEIN: basic helix-loop-helix transcription factor scleraxis [Pogonomyrmex barbatus]